MPLGTAYRALLGVTAAGGPWDVIDSVELGSAAASISFASIDSKYKLFRVTAYIVKDGTGGRIDVRFNNDSGTNYDRQALEGSNTSVAATRATGQTSLQSFNAMAASQAETVEFVVAKQVSGSPAMVVLAASKIATGSVIVTERVAGRWNNTADLINRIDLISSAGNFAAGTTAVIEGLAD